MGKSFSTQSLQKVTFGPKVVHVCGDRWWIGCRLVFWKNLGGEGVGGKGRRGDFFLDFRQDKKMVSYIEMV